MNRAARRRLARFVSRQVRRINAAAVPSLRPRIEILEGRTLFSVGNTLGIPDVNFSTDGKQTDNFRKEDDATAVDFLSTGESIVVGTTAANNSDKDGVIEKFDTAGNRDTTFNGGANGGRVVIDLGSDEIITDVFIDSQDRIVVCGVTGDVANEQGDFFVQRFLSDGTADTNFNGGAAVTHDFGGLDAPGGLIVNPTSGRITVAGISVDTTALSTHGTALWFLTDAGADDTSLGAATVVTDPGVAAEGATSIIPGPNDTFFTAGFSIAVNVVPFPPSVSATGLKFLVQQFNADGSPHTAFGGDGRAETADFGQSVELATGIDFDANLGQVVAAGVSANGLLASVLSPAVVGLFPQSVVSVADFAAAKWNLSGSLVSQFGGDGTVTADFDGKLDAATDVSLMQDGSVVAGGGTDNSDPNIEPDFAMARWDKTGTLEPTFGDPGQETVDFSSHSDGSFGQQEQSDGNIVFVGHTKDNNAGTGDFALVRLTNDDSAPAVPAPVADASQPDTTGLPATLIGGQKKKNKGKIKVTITNDGDATLNGPVTIQIVSSGDTTFDGGDTSLGGTTKKLKLKVGKSKTISVTCTFGAVDNDEDVNILAKVTGTGVSDPNGVVVNSASTVHVQEARISLAGNLTPQGPIAVAYNKKKSLTIPITNNGNVTGNGTGSATVFVTTDGTLDPGAIVTQFAIAPKLKVKPGATKNFKLKLPKVTPLQLAAGTYFLVIQLNTAGSTPTNDTDGNVVAIIQITLG